MAKIESSTLPSGLPVHRIDLEGTRAATVLVAFDAGARTERAEENGMAHFLCRAEVIGEAIDLLTDFVGRPKLDSDELDRERGVVIQEIARANDQPAVVAEHLIDRAAFG